MRNENTSKNYCKKYHLWMIYPSLRLPGDVCKKKMPEIMEEGSGEQN